MFFLRLKTCLCPPPLSERTGAARDPTMQERVTSAIPNQPDNAWVHVVVFPLLRPHPASILSFLTAPLAAGRNRRSIRDAERRIIHAGQRRQARHRLLCFFFVLGSLLFRRLLPLLPSPSAHTRSEKVTSRLGATRHRPEQWLPSQLPRWLSFLLFSSLSSSPFHSPKPFPHTATHTVSPTA
jgi:hypothetical protein